MRLLYQSAFVVAMAAAVASCGSSSTSPTDNTPPVNNSAAVSIPLSDIYGLSSFNPGSVTVAVGNSVDIANNDAVVHHPTADDGTWDFALGPGDDGTHKFTVAGTYSYHCSIHPSMTGQIIVK